MRGDPIICMDCRECVARETRWKDGAKRDVCSLCALKYDGPSWSLAVDTMLTESRHVGKEKPQ